MSSTSVTPKPHIQSKWAWVGIWLTCFIVGIMVGVIRHISCKGKCTPIVGSDDDGECNNIAESYECDDEPNCVWDDLTSGGAGCYAILAIGGLVGLLTCIAYCCCCWRMLLQSHACMTPPSRWVNWFNIGHGTADKCDASIVDAQKAQRLAKVVQKGQQQ